MDRKTLLIVDDDDSTLSSLVVLLKSDAVTLRTASTAEEAEALLKSHTFDLVITDLHLSGRVGLEGLEVISRVKAQSPQTPVVLFTAFGSPEIEQEARRRGATDYWVKTMHIRTLVEKVRTLGIPVGQHRKAEK
jgi:DNA-binding NtrC family response regulator